MIDSHCEVELWNSIVVEADYSHHALQAITHDSHRREPEKGFNVMDIRGAETLRRAMGM